MVGTDDQVRRAVCWGAGGRPVLLAGGIATGEDTRAALAAGQME